MYGVAIDHDKTVTDYKKIEKQLKDDLAELEKLRKDVKFLKEENDRIAKENQKLRGEKDSWAEQLNDLKRPVVVSRGYDKAQMSEMIENVLDYLGEKNIVGYKNLLLLTAQVESDMGHLSKQKKGPAKGIFQMEPNTEKCIWENYLKNDKGLATKIENLRTDKTPKGISQLESSVTYAISMAYVHYKRANVKIKNPADVVELAEIHKKYYNTYKGKTKVSESIKKTLNTGLIAKK